MISTAGDVLGLRPHDPARRRSPDWLTERLANAFTDRRHPSYTDHPLRTLFAQRIFQVASGYEDGNDANALRADPMFKLAVERTPLDADTDLASASTFSRLENAATTKDVYRLAKAFLDQFLASYATAPELIVLDMDHSEDATYGQQQLSFYNHHYRSHCYLPLFLFEGISGSFPSPRRFAPASADWAENAMILKRCSSTCAPPGPRRASSCAATRTSPTPS